MSRQLFDLTGRVALVTGGSKGLGKAMARGFAEAGADVVISSRHEDELRPTAAEIRSGTGVRVAHFVADMTRREDVRRLADSALAEMGHVDILVNNAGTNNPQPIDAIGDADWDRLVELNLNSCMALTRSLVGPMKERQWGRIIYISSIMGFTSAPGQSAVLGHQERPDRSDARRRERPGRFRHHGQLPGPRTVPDGPSRQPPERSAAGRLRSANGPGPMGKSRGAGGPGAVARE